jgi:hypothetical protein
MSITTTVEINLTPEQVAEAFWHLNSDDMCTFFKELHRVSLETAPHALDTQMCWVAGELQKDPDRSGISAMRTIADFAYKFGRLDQSAESWML